jgi:hypothetical protein
MLIRIKFSFCAHTKRKRKKENKYIEKSGHFLLQLVMNWQAHSNVNNNRFQQMNFFSLTGALFLSCESQSSQIYH